MVDYEWQIQKSILMTRDPAEIKNIFLSSDPDRPLVKSTYRSFQNGTPLHIAIKSQDPEIVDVIIQLFTEQNKTPNTNSKVDTSNREFSRWINQTDKNGHTPLHLACMGGNIEILTKLDSLGADPLIKSSKGKSVLHFAAEYDQIAAFYYYKDKLDLDTKDNAGNTPLIWTIKQRLNHETHLVASFLIAHGKINVNVQNDIGWTALHCATDEGKTWIVIKLIAAGADQNLETCDGETSLALAYTSEVKIGCFTRTNGPLKILQGPWTATGFVDFFLLDGNWFINKGRSRLILLVLAWAYRLLINLCIEFHFFNVWGWQISLEWT